ncbi:hypothetical protein [Streptomyces sp. NBC_01546]|uniref:hypothetical protein n=1 Tax=Streptomyces sp. NBC_01546 TaxID=2975872 RepID=UPI00386B575C
MKESQRQGGAATLNVYTVSGNGLLGWTASPHLYSTNPSGDGVVLSFTTLPGGTATEDGDGAMP